MSEMLNVVIGKLENEPNLRPTNIGEKAGLISTNMLLIDTEEGAISVPLVAKDTAAKELQRYNKNEEIQFIGVLNLSNKRKDAINFFIPGYLVLHIDHERELTNIQDDLLKSFL